MSQQRKNYESNYYNARIKPKRQKEKEMIERYPAAIVELLHCKAIISRLTEEMKEKEDVISALITTLKLEEMS